MGIKIMVHDEKCGWMYASFSNCAGPVQPIVYGCLKEHIGSTFLCAVHHDKWYDGFCEGKWSCGLGHQIVEYLKKDGTVRSFYDQ
jgi:hypothetical protein